MPGKEQFAGRIDGNADQRLGVERREVGTGYLEPELLPGRVADEQFCGSGINEAVAAVRAAVRAPAKLTGYIRWPHRAHHTRPRRGVWVAVSLQTKNGPEVGV